MGSRCFIVRNIVSNNGSIVSLAGMPMPSQVTLSPSSIPGSAIGVFTRDWIKEGTEMGPYTGRIVLPNDVSPNLNNSFMWEVIIFKLFFLHICIYINRYYKDLELKYFQVASYTHNHKPYPIRLLCLWREK